MSGRYDSRASQHDYSRFIEAEFVSEDTPKAGEFGEPDAQRHDMFEEVVESIHEAYLSELPDAVPPPPPPPQKPAYDDHFSTIDEPGARKRATPQREAHKRFTALDVFPDETKYDETHPLSMQEKIKHRIYNEKSKPRLNRFEDLNPGPVPETTVQAQQNLDHFPGAKYNGENHYQQERPPMRFVKDPPKATNVSQKPKTSLSEDVSARNVGEPSLEDQIGDVVFGEESNTAGQSKRLDWNGNFVID